VAVALASAGARVAISGRDLAALERVEERMNEAARPKARARGDAALILPADLLALGAAGELVERASQRLGGLDLVVSNAGAGWAGPLSEMTSSEIDALVDLNFRAPLHLAHAALPHLTTSPLGRLVIVGSIAGRLGVAREVIYSASKAGLVGLADALRTELAGTGVTVSLVTPGAVDTAFFDRRNRPYERGWPHPIPASLVADAVLECARTGRAEVIVPSWLVVAVRLQGAFPGFYRWLANRFG
jgi:uncharacterized protein